MRKHFTNSCSQAFYRKPCSKKFLKGNTQYVQKATSGLSEKMEPAGFSKDTFKKKELPGHAYLIPNLLHYHKQIYLAFQEHLL